MKTMNLPWAWIYSGSKEHQRASLPSSSRLPQPIQHSPVHSPADTESVPLVSAKLKTVLPKNEQSIFRCSSTQCQYCILHCVTFHWDSIASGSCHQWHWPLGRNAGLSTRGCPLGYAGSVVSIAWCLHGNKAQELLMLSNSTITIHCSDLNNRNF